MTVIILSRASLITSDVIVLLVTWWQLYGSLMPRSQQSRPLSTLSVLLLRDSTSYFLVFLLFNVAQIIAQMRFSNGSNPIPSFMLPMTTIVISRLILSLRHLSSTMRTYRQCGTNTSAPTWDAQASIHRSILSTIIFRPNSPPSRYNADQTPSELQKAISPLVSFEDRPFHASGDVSDGDTDADET
ncbi:uncharacterized protein C8Q71DRAFT_393066 [Rhodofomes roseus]|uniref:Transmembrane protein n=1 Tax=Rhodofomes roseus TaxID=34475 RepID=A0ABQ8JZR9_9APHY|nr:uncharacterized protein C8Q71DRAFT_393066 [Rhodofomes roseus]KAH9829884.1 hypothetical protein C8Q71DRAFT_393066 [Rhodofomes roseus]